MVSSSCVISHSGNGLGVGLDNDSNRDFSREETCFKPAREQALEIPVLELLCRCSPPALPAASMRLAQDHLLDSVPLGVTVGQMPLNPYACFSKKTAVFFVVCRLQC